MIRDFPRLRFPRSASLGYARDKRDRRDSQNPRRPGVCIMGKGRRHAVPGGRSLRSQAALQSVTPPAGFRMISLK